MRPSAARTSPASRTVSPSSSSPRVASRARVASRVARIAAAGLVVSSSSKDSSSRARSSDSPRASRYAPCVKAVSVLCAEVTIASAPSASACGGSDGWNPRCAPQAWSTTSGMPLARVAAEIAGMSERTPTYDGSTRNTARASGARSSASSILAAGTASGSPVPGSMSGRTHTGSSPASTNPANSDLCRLREAMTRSPGRPTASASAWLPCVEPFRQKRQRSAPHSPAASRSACPSTSPVRCRSSAPVESGRS